MKQHLNTLYVTTQGVYLSKEGETVVVSKDKVRLIQLPIKGLGGIVCFGQVTCSPFLLGFCGEQGVAVSFLTENGRFLARVYGSTSGNVLLRREQYRRADDERHTLLIATPIVAAKIVNARTVLMRALRDHPSAEGSADVKHAVGHLSALLGKLETSTSLDMTRGIEGAAARSYFEVFDHLIVQQKDDFWFRQRNRRPPLDNVNALLSFAYTLLMHDVVGALEAVGLDPSVGFLHRDRPGRPGLALDVMEEFRPWVADRLVLSLVNLRQLTSADFVVTESGAVNMTENGRKTLVAAYQRRKQEQIIHSFLGENVTVGLLLHLQSLLLARYLRGDLDGYPPFAWK